MMKLNESKEVYFRILNIWAIYSIINLRSKMKREEFEQPSSEIEHISDLSKKISENYKDKEQS